ncbi:hypothetical protein DICVIV_00651 [Dictyocaulus viviparus]|uniref:Uncharacterized protein n=1 Tax=Dictyocaulus viviparus TaxID=29172 RepID=A0A0D8Y8H7_DICVI|nr:hypothetical protein DICVIV_00651 [Dictyocaulus viviparus]
MHATTSRQPSCPDRPLPIIEPGNANASIQQAHELALRRVAHYKSTIDANRHETADQRFFSEERITLQDGGEIHSGSTPEGRFYYVMNNANQWLFLERSTDQRLQTLLVSENSNNGPTLTQQFVAR